jgi:hypothetical protein
VLRDVTSVYVAYAPDLAWPGAYDAVSSFVERAVEQGVRRLVLPSGRGEPVRGDDGLRVPDLGGSDVEVAADEIGQPTPYNLGRPTRLPMDDPAGVPS